MFLQPIDFLPFPDNDFTGTGLANHPFHITRRWAVIKRALGMVMVCAVVLLGVGGQDINLDGFTVTGNLGFRF